MRLLRGSSLKTIQENNWYEIHVSQYEAKIAKGYLVILFHNLIRLPVPDIPQYLLDSNSKKVTIPIFTFPDLSHIQIG